MAWPCVCLWWAAAKGPLCAMGPRGLGDTAECFAFLRLSRVCQSWTLQLEKVVCWFLLFLSMGLGNVTQVRSEMLLFLLWVEMTSGATDWRPVLCPRDQTALGMPNEALWIQVLIYQAFLLGCPSPGYQGSPFLILEPVVKVLRSRKLARSCLGNANFRMQKQNDWSRRVCWETSIWPVMKEL